ncbi:MAG: YggT family protein [Candidatus Omnitrophica bacterium]|nr:YggT family protein [Candidatus Omnitrophota bacterium]
MSNSDLVAILARFLGDALVLVLLYDFFSQPFRFYGMDPLTQFVWSAARKICLPFETVSRKIVRLPDRDLTPLFALVIVLFCRGLLYAATAIGSGGGVATVVVGVTLSFLELFTRLLIPGILFLIYIDIQLARHQESFIGNVFVMILHDIAKRFVVLIRKVLFSYKPLYVFISVFIFLSLFKWVLVFATLLPFSQSNVMSAFPQILQPLSLDLIDRPLLLLPVVMFRLGSTFLYGIFILLLLNMLTSFSGLDPYDRFAVLLGLVCSPWVIFARRFFSFARVGNIDFSVAILLIIIFMVQGVIEGVLRSLGGL